MSLNSTDNSLDYYDAARSPIISVVVAFGYGTLMCFIFIAVLSIIIIFMRLQQTKCMHTDLCTVSHIQ